jgi:hypothetical protein
MGAQGSRYTEYKALAETTSSDVIEQMNATFNAILAQSGGTPTNSHSDVLTHDAMVKHMSTIHSFLPVDRARRVVQALVGCTPSAKNELQSHTLSRQAYVIAAVTLAQGATPQRVAIYTSLLGLPQEFAPEAFAHSFMELLDSCAKDTMTQKQLETAIANNDAFRDMLTMLATAKVVCDVINATLVLLSFLQTFNNGDH